MKTVFEIYMHELESESLEDCLLDMPETIDLEAWLEDQETEKESE